MEFEPVPTRKAHAGWSVEKQRDFLVHLAATGSVTEACDLVGMTVRSAYYLRVRFEAESFRTAWTHALAIARDRLLALAYDRAIHGSVRSLWKDGKLVAQASAPSDRLLQQLLQLNRPSNHYSPQREMLRAFRDLVPMDLHALEPAQPATPACAILATPPPPISARA